MVMSIDEAIHSFEIFLLTKRRVAANTRAAYQHDLAQLKEFMNNHNLDFSILTQLHLREFIAYLKKNKLSAQSIGRKISTCKTFFKFLSQEYGFENIAKELIFPKKERKLPHYLTESELEAIFLASDTDGSVIGMRNKMMLYLMYATGMRVSELIALKTTDIHRETGMILITGKGNKERMVPVPFEILTMLVDYIINVRPQVPGSSESPYLFLAYYGKKARALSRQSCWNIIRLLWEKTGIKKDISPHQLRHSLATHLLKNGVDLRSIQLWLGHQNLVTVQIYTHIEKSHVREIYNKKHPRS